MEFKLELRDERNTGNDDMLKLNELSLQKDSDLINVIVEKKRIVHLDMNNVAFHFKEELMSFFSKIQKCYDLYLYIDHIYPDVGEALADAIKTLIPNQPSIHLILEEFPDYSSQALIHLAEVLSKMNKTFTLEVNNLSKDSTVLASSVSSLSEAIPSFTLKIPMVDAEFITGIVTKIAANVTSIDLTDCKLGSTEGDFAQVLGAIHESVEVLNLAKNGLGDMDATDLAASFNCLPKGLKELNLGDNDLGNMSAVDLVGSLSSISVNLMSINFYLNNFSCYSGQELNSIFKSLPKTLTKLWLRANDLFTLAPEQLGIAFTNFHETVTFLDLGYNIDETGSLKPPSVKRMLKLFNSLPKTVVQLDISDNCFGWLPEHKLLDIFSCTSPNIRWLGLSSNHFEEKSGATLARMFDVMPDSLRAIDLGKNRLSEKTDAELLQALMGFKDNVISIDLEHNRLFIDKTPAQRDALLVALRQVNPYGDRLNLAHNGESVIARALAPLHSAVRQGMMNIDIIDNLILPYLTPKEDVIKNSFDYSFFRQVSDSQVQENPVVEVAMEEDAVDTIPMEQDTEMEIALAPQTMKRPRDNNYSEQATKKAKL